MGERGRKEGQLQRLEEERLRKAEEERSRQAEAERSRLEEEKRRAMAGTFRTFKLELELELRLSPRKRLTGEMHFLPWPLVQ